MTRTDTRRGGFTLVEMMVVILLIIILAALSAGAFYKIQASQRVGATEATMRKIQINMDARWKAVLDDARRTVPDALVPLAGGDKDRAISLWTYAKLKNEFPETLVEATTPITFAATSPPIVLQPRKVFVSAATTGSPEGDANFEAAALIYTALTATGTGGTSGDLDGLNQQVGTTPGGRQAFVDNWGTPITFRRWADPDEVQSEPFVRRNVIQTRSGTSYSLNMIDPSGKLLNRLDNLWGNDMNPASLNYQMRMAARNALFPGATWIEWPNRNVVPTLISAGPDKIFGSSIYGADSTDAGSDNVVGYRLRREGAQGN